MAGHPTTAREALAAFLDAVAGNDPDTIAACFAEDAVYTNVPQAPLVGRDAIRAMFASVADRADAVRWDVVSAGYTEGCGRLERVDHFWVGGRQVSIECNGVFEVDPATGLITSVRDYLDLGTYRERLRAATS
jgi:limonene-1,2-epoxide hydrolase